MISPNGRPKCDCCGQRATRPCDDSYGTTVWLCPSCPSPSEIRQRCAEVQAGWDDIQRYCREFRCIRPAVAERLAVHFDADHRKSAVTWATLELYQ